MGEAVRIKFVPRDDITVQELAYVVRMAVPFLNQGMPILREQWDKIDPEIRRHMELGDD